MSEQWLLGEWATTAPKLAPGGRRIVEVYEILEDGDSRTICEAAPDDAEQIVADHNAVLASGARPAAPDAEVERLRTALSHAAETIEREARQHGSLTWTVASIIAKDLRYEATRSAPAATGEGV